MVEMCRDAAEPPADPKLPTAAAGGGDRTSTLHQGVGEIVKAMSCDVAFANGNEAAFALFRRGCRHCAQLPEALEAVESKEVVLDFLARVAARRTTARQLKELCAILVQAAAWRSLLADAPLPLRDLLLADAPLRTALATEVSAVAARKTSALQEPAPAHDARIFLRERRSQRFLSVMEVSPDHCITMTELAASLFVCHAADRREREAEESEGEEESDPGEEEEEAAGAVLGFEHEGVPSHARFLCGQRPWRSRAALRGESSWQLRCAGRRLGAQEEFRWAKGATLQHAQSGLWLFVDPQQPDEVRLHAFERSAWEALPAI